MEKSHLIYIVLNEDESILGFLMKGSPSSRITNIDQNSKGEIDFPKKKSLLKIKVYLIISTVYISKFFKFSFWT